MDSLRTRFAKRTKGTILVEAALFLPVLIYLTMGAFEYSWVFIKTQQLENAARNGLRVAVRNQYTMQEGLDAAADLLNTKYNMSGYNYTIVMTDSTGTALANLDDLDVGDPMTMRITLPYNGTDLEISGIIPVPTALVSSVTMAKE